MAKYHVVTIEWPEGWQPRFPDDVPPRPPKPTGTLGEADDVFAAARRAIEHNEAASQQSPRRWAVVVEPGGAGVTWPGARLCTPLAYKVTGIWWPEGWEPESPLDVPNCVWRSQGEASPERFSYPEAVHRVRSLNRQAMDQATRTWYVVVAVENEPVSKTVSFDPAGTQTSVEVRRLHVIRPEEGGGRGSCAHCPAHSFPCAKQDWLTLEQTVTTGGTDRPGPAV